MTRPARRWEAARRRTARRNRIAPSATCAPSAQSSSATSPSRGAVRRCSIFIASMTIRVWPSVTRSPGAAETTFTSPGIGAASASPVPPASVAAAIGSGGVQAVASPSRITVTLRSWRVSETGRAGPSSPTRTRRPSPAGARSRGTSPAPVAKAKRPGPRMARSTRVSPSGPVSSTARRSGDHSRQPSAAAKGAGSVAGASRPSEAMAASAAASGATGAGAVSAASSRSIRPVSISPSAKPSWASRARRKATLVVRPAISVAASAVRRRVSASARSLPWAITLAIIGS